MAEYYIAPKSSFDATADAIREKTGNQATIEWTENGFADAVSDIPSGYSMDDISTGQFLSNVVITSNTIRRYCFYGVNSLVSVTADNVTSLGGGNAVSMFENCKNLETLHMESLTSVGNSQGFCRGCSKLTTIYVPLLSDLGDASFNNCTSLVVVVLPSATASYRSFAGCTSLQKIDYGAKSGSKVSFENNNFQNCRSLSEIILRNESRVTPLANTNVFTNSTFASSGTGGTIYIPKVLYDHLGDGSSLDYKAATNWSTIDGYGTITWAQIEGSQYENYYADGTSIMTA